MLELADIVRAAGEVYQALHGATLLPSHRRALSDIVACRTAALGGHVQACDHCGTRQLPLLSQPALPDVSRGAGPALAGPAARPPAPVRRLPADLHAAGRTAGPRPRASEVRVRRAHDGGGRGAAQADRRSALPWRAPRPARRAPYLDAGAALPSPRAHARHGRRAARHGSDVGAPTPCRVPRAGASAFAPVPREDARGAPEGGAPRAGAARRLAPRVGRARSARGDGCEGARVPRALRLSRRARQQPPRTVRTRPGDIPLP